MLPSAASLPWEVESRESENFKEPSSCLRGVSKKDAGAGDRGPSVARTAQGHAGPLWGGRSVTESKLLEAIASTCAEAENTRDLPIAANSRLVEDLGLDSIDSSR